MILGGIQQAAWIVLVINHINTQAETDIKTFSENICFIPLHYFNNLIK